MQHEITELPFLQNVLHFAQLLRQVGIAVTLEQTLSFAQALLLIDIGNREQVYHTARGLLVSRHEHLRLFHLLFQRFWRLEPSDGRSRGQKAPVAPRHDLKPAQQFTVVTYMAYKARQFDRELDVGDKAGTFSDVELLQHKDFSLMTPEELTTLKRLLQDMRWQISLRTTRRWTAKPQGRTLDLRRVLRAAGHYGGVPLRLAWRDPKIKPRPLVLIADISGSMEKYARLLLQFFYCLSHSFQDVECFVFGTRLTRITPQLRLKNIDRAIDDAAHTVVDWAGGTRIGASLQTFNQRWSRRVLGRGALVLVVSDGWERGDVAPLRQAMRYLQRRCHRLIWLNPLSGQERYQPRVEGMNAALPYIDDFLPIHNLQSLTQLAAHLAKLV